MRLAGKRAIVTGASSGIGRAVAAALAGAGAAVDAVARESGDLDALAAEVAGSEAGGCIVARPLDLRDDAALDTAIAGWRSGVETVDVLVHCAGVISHAILQEASVDDLDLQYAVNVRAAYRLTQGVLPKLIASRGDVAVMNSSAMHFPRAHSGQFAAMTHALKGFTDSLREELNPHVRVLSIFPGKTATPRQQRLHAASGADYAPERLLQPEDVASILVAALALPDTAEVTEIRIRPRLKG